MKRIGVDASRRVSTFILAEKLVIGEERSLRKRGPL